MDWIPKAMTATAKDYFSKQSAEYAKYRPQYPDELFVYLASLVPHHDLAVDCATGNGQAAIGLAQHFRRVVGVDQSADQLAHASPHPRIAYHVGKVEALSLDSRSVDAITVAQALHWFSLEEFYAVVRRVLKPSGILAVWTYSFHQINPEVDAIVRHYHDNVLDGYWPPERGHIVDGYRLLPFPFRQTTPPRIEMQTAWTLEHLLGYLRSWSATQRYLDAHGSNPLSLIENTLRELWGVPDGAKDVRWPLNLRVGCLS
jgi:SAM-dependent methyltransferase